MMPIAEALVATAKAGKSLLMLDVCAAGGCGRSGLDQPAQEPFDVLYVDAENSRDDLVERLTDLGYGPGDLARLHYVSFPTLPPLDTFAGGRDLIELAEHYNAALVVMCHSGGRSRRAAEFLQSKGFAQVANLAGGIDAWAREIDPSLASY